MWLFRNIIFYVVNFVVFQLSCINYLTDEVVWYSHEIFLGAAALLFLVMAAKWRSKWTGILTLNRRRERYGIFFTARLSKKFLNWTYLFYGTEAVVSLVFPFIYYYFDEYTWPFGTLLLFNGIESVYFLVMNTRKGNFKLGMNNNAVVHNARGTYVLPFHDLKSIVYKYDEYFFIYRSGETLTIPDYIVSAEDMQAVKQHLARKAAEHGFFITEKLRDK